MPQSVREQIMQAIAKAADDSQRAMLLIMLGLADMMDNVCDTVKETATSVAEFRTSFDAHDAHERAWRAANFHNIPPADHVADHGFTARERVRRAADQELVNEAKKGAANKLGGLLVELGKVVLLLAAGGLMHRLLG